MGEVKGGVFASSDNFCCMGGREQTKNSLVWRVFHQTIRQKKKNPETRVPGLKKPRLKIQTYLVTFGVKPASFDSKGL